MAATQTQAEIAKREADLAAQAPRFGANPEAVIRQDRAERWAEWRTAFIDRMEAGAGGESWQVIKDAETALTKKYGPRVGIERHTLDWITALMVLRWGECEAVWPAAFTADDAQRFNEIALKARFVGLDPKFTAVAQ